jgi:hypothetical protein
MLATSARGDVGTMEALLGRPLSDREREGVTRLDEERARALEPVRGAYAGDLAAATGLPRPAILSVLPRSGL